MIEAVANGRRAAASIHGFLAGGAEPEVELFAAVRWRTPAESKLVLSLATSSRAHVAPRGREADPSATVPGFDEATAQAEAARCVRCDAIYACQHVQLAALPALTRAGPAGSSPDIGVEGGYA